MRMFVTEDMIRQAARTCGPDSKFFDVLECGEKYKEAGLTPIYIYDNDIGYVEVVTAENHRKHLN